MVFNNVFPRIDRDFRREAYRLTRKNSAPGIDQGTATQSAEPVEDNLRALHERWRDHQYVAPPGERVGSEKDGGQQRPRGQPCCEDKMGQRAVVMSLAAIFAPDFQALSHGFRKGHRPPQALHELREQGRTWPIHWRGEAEVRGCCDNGDWGWLRACIQPRVQAGGILRRLGQWRHAGVLEAGALTHPDKGTPQGGVATPRTQRKTFVKWNHMFYCEAFIHAIHEDLFYQ